MKFSLGVAAAILAASAHAYVDNEFESKELKKAELPITTNMVEEAVKQVKRHRDAHAKANGCVDEVRFEVRRDLDKEYQVGFFAVPGATYEGVLRSSNGSGDLNVSDPKGGGQGLALKFFVTNREQIAKLHKIQGETYFREVPRKYYVTQDFLGINFPEFFSKDAFDYAVFGMARGEQAKAEKQAEKEGKSKEEAQKLGAAKFASIYFAPSKIKNKELIEREQEVFKGLSKKTLNPLVEDFFSMVPSLFGADRAVKYRMHPCDKDARKNYRVPEGIDAEKDDHYLAKTLAHHLRTQATCYKLSVQFHEKGFPSVEDATAVWGKGAEPKWVELGTITIPKKQAGKELMDSDLCEFPSYTPWRTLVDHQPIGSIQRVREPIYAEIFRQRHENRGHVKQEN